MTSLAFIAANLGAQEVIGMCASGAKYGMMTVHFYWGGAIPAMLFVGLFMMPFYCGSKAWSVPEYLKLRFDDKTRALNAFTFAIMTIFSSGVSLYALGLLFQIVLGWSFHSSVWLSAAIVLIYTMTGGLKSAIYNEVLQFFLITLGFALLSILLLRHTGGWAGIKSRLPAAMTHTCKYVAHGGSNNPMGVDAFGLIGGLGFVLAFGYWCTDFLVIQRAMAARSVNESQLTPIYAAFPKMAMPFVVILPGIAAVAASHMHIGYALPTQGGHVDFDQVVFSLIVRFYPEGMVGIGITALLASFMSGMAGNVTAFNTVWTYDIYQGYIKRRASDRHYLSVARAATFMGVVLSVATAYVARNYNDIMDVLQLVFGFVNAPLFATVLLGMFCKRATGHGAFTGLLAGTAAAAFVHGLTAAEGKGGWLSTLQVFPSVMAQNFWIAIFAWTSCFVMTILVSLMTIPKCKDQLQGLVYGMPISGNEVPEPWYRRPRWIAGIAVGAWAALNLIFW